MATKMKEQIAGARMANPISNGEFAEEEAVCLPLLGGYRGKVPGWLTRIGKESGGKRRLAAVNGSSKLIMDCQILRLSNEGMVAPGGLGVFSHWPVLDFGLSRFGNRRSGGVRRLRVGELRVSYQ